MQGFVFLTFQLCILRIVNLKVEACCLADVEAINIQFPLLLLLWWKIYGPILGVTDIRVGKNKN